MGTLGADSRQTLPWDYFTVARQPTTNSELQALPYIEWRDGGHNEVAVEAAEFLFVHLCWPIDHQLEALRVRRGRRRVHQKSSIG